MILPNASNTRPATLRGRELEALRSELRQKEAAEEERLRRAAQRLKVSPDFFPGQTPKNWKCPKVPQVVRCNPVGPLWVWPVGGMRCPSPCLLNGAVFWWYPFLVLGGGNVKGKPKGNTLLEGSPKKDTHTHTHIVPRNNQHLQEAGASSNSGGETIVQASLWESLQCAGSSRSGLSVSFIVRVV